MGTDNTTSAVDQSSALDVALKHIHIATLVIYCIVFLVGTVGNGLVIYVTGFRMKKTVNSVWFLNLALADFLFTAFLIFSIISFSQGNQWPFGYFMCKLNSFVSVINMFASIFLLTAISIDRCLSIWVVVWAHNKRTVCKAQILCAVIWVAAGLCSAPYVTYRTVLETSEEKWCTYAFTTEQKWGLFILRVVIGFLIPFLVILVCYVAIGVRAGRLQRTRKQRSRRILVAIICAFFICWLPFHVMNFIEFKAGSNQDLWNIVRIGGPPATSLAFLNSCLNPILYVFMCEEFQKKLKRSVCFVLESALAEDHLSFMSSRSFSSHLSRISRKSDSSIPLERKGTAASLTFTECKVPPTEETTSTE